jgi:glycogen debranching enzyme
MMDEVIQVQDQFYILASTSLAQERRCVLKHGDTFAIFDSFGDIAAYGLGEQGLYHEGTRFLSRLRLLLDGRRPLLLSSRVREQNDLFGADLTNPDLSIGDQTVRPRDLLHIFRSRFLWEGRWYERLRLWNYSLAPMPIRLGFQFAADYADIFEVRGMHRARRGRRLDPAPDHDGLVLGYEGLDGVVRRTGLAWHPPPDRCGADTAEFSLELPAHSSASLSMTITCAAASPPAMLAIAPTRGLNAVAPVSPLDAPPGRAGAYDTAFDAAAERMAAARRGWCHIYTSNEQFNDWLNRSTADLQMMISETQYGPYPYAGVPWFSTPFGRDGIITALQLLWSNPAVARGTLAFLAATQARAFAPSQDAEPGKILHETRGGEMARLGEVPFGRYYGSVDATPLFVILAGAYHRRTADDEFIRSLWDSIERALAWIDDYGDRDGDGLIEYARYNPNGLVHQGWKDSSDSIFHDDGSFADGPIALCEVQAYAFEARREGARLARRLGHADRAVALDTAAHRLRREFERRFWCEELGTYALALDGAKRACRVRTSNAGHCLFAGIASPERARTVAGTLLSADSFSGWGIRTVASNERRYNPMSYHNGSVWPHDNSIIAVGLRRYGLRELVLKPLTGLFDASLFVDLSRLPELFCGFHRRGGEGPTLYPVACAPQAWAAGAGFLLLQAALGLVIDGRRRRVAFYRPLLPPFLEEIRIRNLRVGEGTLDLVLERRDNDVGISVPRRDGDIVVSKLS